MDKHVSKMILESAQLLCAANHLHGKGAPYRLTHKNHPCTKWVCESIGHWFWLRGLAEELNREFQYRFSGAPHKSWLVIDALDMPSLPVAGFREPPTCVADDLRHLPVIEAYRAYYRRDKAHIAKWTLRGAPSWYDGEQHEYHTSA
jgi:hypothetical protein